MEILTNTVNTQINDIKVLPIIIPSPALMIRVEQLVAKICEIIADASLSLDVKKKQVVAIEAQIDAAIADTWRLPKKAA